MAEEHQTEDQEYTRRAEALIEKWRPFLKVGDVYDRYPSLHKEHPNRFQIQIRAFVDEDQIVTRRWLSGRGYWYYEVNWIYEFALNLESGSFVLLEEHEYDEAFREDEE